MPTTGNPARAGTARRGLWSRCEICYWKLPIIAHVKMPVYNPLSSLKASVIQVVCQVTEIVYNGILERS